MEDIAPLHHFILYLKEDLSSGVSLRVGVKNYVQLYPGLISEVLMEWMYSHESGQLDQFYLKQKKITTYQRNLLTLMDRAQEGVGILTILNELEKEVEIASKIQIEAHLGQLPFKLMIPLLLFKFPALLLLILGPLVIKLMSEIQ